MEPSKDKPVEVIIRGFGRGFKNEYCAMMSEREASNLKQSMNRELSFREEIEELGGCLEEIAILGLGAGGGIAYIYCVAKIIQYITH